MEPEREKRIDYCSIEVRSTSAVTSESAATAGSSASALQTEPYPAVVGGYGLYLWPCASVLSAYIVNRRADFASSTVLEVQQ